MSSRTTRKRKIQTPTTDTLPDKPNKIDKSLPETIYPEETRVSKDFFDKSSYDLARALLGKILVHKVDGELVKCIIIETELYPGGDDKASVSYNNRRTAANEPVYGPPGTTWVYLTYGMHHCINISSADHGGAVLLRAGEPLDGLDKLMDLRIKNLKMSRDLKIKDLCNGPAKLCKAMGIDKKTCNGLNVADSNKLWIEEYANEGDIERIISAKRVGIDRSGDVAVNQLWRFYYYNHPCVTRREPECEEQ